MAIGDFLKQTGIWRNKSNVNFNPATDNDFDAGVAAGWDNKIFEIDQHLSTLKPPFVPIVVKTASYTLAAGDHGSFIQMNVGSANNLNVLTNAAAAIPEGFFVTIRQQGAGVTTLVPATGVSIRREDTVFWSLKARARRLPHVTGRHIS